MSPMVGTYQVPEASSTAGAAMARTRAPEWAAKALAQADVNMAVTKPQGRETVNAISAKGRRERTIPPAREPNIRVLRASVARR
jgi:hypothetical protein